MFSLQHISKSFRKQTILNSVSLDVPAGEIVAVLGTSGSGKSTLLNIAAGLLMPDSGRILLNGAKQNGLPPEQRRTAMMFQDSALLPHLNVRDNAAFGLILRGLPKAQARQRADAVLEEVGLSGFGSRPPANLSGGEQQRVALARALLSEPELLLLDEPFSALDTVLRGRLQEQVCQTVQQYRIPAILVTHDPGEACRTAARIALLSSGSLIQSGTPAELLSRPINAHAARLLGCLNVSEQHYIPPEAIHADPHGQGCRLRALYAHPFGYRAEALHPHWGELNLFCNAAEAEQLKKSCKISIETTKIVHFAP